MLGCPGATPHARHAASPHIICPTLQQNWPNGELVGQCQEHTDAKACREACAARHDCSNDVSTGITTAWAWATAVAIRITPHRPTLQQNWSNGEPVGRCQEHTDAEARHEACATRHDCCNNVSTGITTAWAWATAVAIHIGPHLESIGGLAVVIPHPT